jgi:hypothetical protein
MNRLLVASCVLLVFFGFAVQTWGAPSDTVLVKVTVLASLSVDITESEINLGSVSIGSNAVSLSGVTVTNTGSGVAETYSLSLADPAGWTASQTAAAADKYVLNAAFDSAGSVTWNTANHALSATPVVCTSTKFAAIQTGVAVPYNSTRTLWFQFLAPTSTAVNTERAITVTITAQAA